MTVAENILVAVAPEHLRRHGDDARIAMRRMLDVVGFTGHLEARVSSLSVARRHLLELAKAFAAQPKLLILDEPTAPLSPGVRRPAVPRRPRPRGAGHGGGLHHAPTRRGPRDRRPRHGPARRAPPRHLVGRGHHGRRAARADHRPHALVDVPAEARAGRRRSGAAGGGGPRRPGLLGHLVRRATRRDRGHRGRRRQRPAGAPAHPRGPRQRHGGDHPRRRRRADPPRRCGGAPPTCRRTATPRA